MLSVSVCLCWSSRQWPGKHQHLHLIGFTLLIGSKIYCTICAVCSCDYIGPCFTRPGAKEQLGISRLQIAELCILHLTDEGWANTGNNTDSTDDWTHETTRLSSNSLRFCTGLLACWNFQEYSATVCVCPGSRRSQHPHNHAIRSMR